MGTNFHFKVKKGINYLCPVWHDFCYKPASDKTKSTINMHYWIFHSSEPDYQQIWKITKVILIYYKMPKSKLDPFSKIRTSWPIAYRALYRSHSRLFLSYTWLCLVGQYFWKKCPTERNRGEKKFVLLDINKCRIFVIKYIKLFKILYYVPERCRFSYNIAKMCKLGFFSIMCIWKSKKILRILCL